MPNLFSQTNLKLNQLSNQLRTMKFIMKAKSQKYLTNILLILLQIYKYLQKKESVTFTRNNLSEKEMVLKNI